MSVGSFNVDADKVSRGSNLPSSNNWTFFCFIFIPTGASTAFAVIQSLDDGGDFQQFALDVGRIPNVYDGFGNGVAGVSLTEDKWWALGYSSNGTTLRLWTKNITDAGATTEYTSTARAGTASINNIHIGGSGFNEPFTAGYIARPLMYNAAWTQTEFDAQVVSLTPVSSTNIYAALTFEDNTAAAMQDDTSGNGFDFTRGAGAWSTESEPPLSAPQTIVASAAILQLSALGDTTRVANFTGDHYASDVILREGEVSPTDVRLFPVGRQHIVPDYSPLTLTAGLATVVQGPPVGDQNIDALAATLTLSAGTPTVTATATIAAQAAVLTLSAGAPTVVQEIDAQAAVLTLSAGAPTVTSVATIAAQAATLSLTAGAPKVVQEIDASAAVLTLSAGAPTVSSVATIAAQAATLSLTAGAPKVVQEVDAQAAILTLSAGAPTVTTSATIAAQAAELHLTAGLFTVVAEGAPQTVTAEAAILNLTAGTPAVKATNEVQAQAAVLTLSAGAPTVNASANILAEAAILSLSAGLFTVVQAGSDVVIEAEAAVLTLSAGAFRVRHPDEVLLPSTPSVSRNPLGTRLTSTLQPTTSSPKTTVVLGTNIKLKR